MIYPDNFEIKIGFNKIKEMLTDLCLSSLGQGKTTQLKFLTDYDQINTAVNQVDEFKQICLFEDNFPVSYYFDVTPSLKKIRVEGAFLEVNELFDLKRSLESIKGIISFFKNSDEDKYTYLKRLIHNVMVYPFVTDKINSIITTHGRIKDNASAELASIRVQLRDKQAGVSKRMQSLLKKAQSEGLTEPDATLSIRDGRIVIPVNSSNKRKIRGIIHDESASGKTSYIEPAEIVEINNEIKELEYAERREIQRILVAFSDAIRPYLDDLLNAYCFLATIDFVRAKAKLAIRLGGVKTQLRDQPYLDWKQAKHPLLFLSLQKENKQIVPLDIRLNEEKRIALISGPNAGGKSVCLQTVGILQYMFQCGLLPPMEENSETGIFQRIFIDIGDEQSIENDLSTYSSHLLNMKFFIKNADNNSLLLIDEFGTGTEPMLGGAIAEAVLARLNQSKTFGIVTTHYTNLKHFASSAEGIENGAMLFDTAMMQPLFQLRLGKPGSSFAFEIARKIGLPEDILQEATKKIGEDHINFDKHLKDVIRDKRYWESKRAKIRQSEKELDEMLQKYAEELKNTEKIRKEVVNKSKQEANELLENVNKKIENTIRLIRESSAEKEKTKEARKELDTLKESVLQKQQEDDDKINRKIEKLRQREQRIHKERSVDNQEEPEAEVNTVISKGDKVKLAGQEVVGEVLDTSHKSILVAFGNIVATVEHEKLEKLSKSEYKKSKKKQQVFSVSQGIDLRARKLEFVPRIDVRGQRAEDALRTVTEFIDESIMVGATEVRILHGKGNGILRQLIRDYLQTVDLINTIKDEQLAAGGAGITVVNFNY